MLGKLTIDDFRDRVGDSFLIQVDGECSIQTRLIQVAELGTGVPGGRTPFSVIFQSASTDYVPQRLYDVEHEQLGTLGIFLVPLGADAGGMRYEAILT